MTNQEMKLLHERMKKEDPKLLVLMEKCFDAGVLSGKEQAQRKPLTDEEIVRIKQTMPGTLDVQFVVFARAIEAAHGIKGEA